MKRIFIIGAGRSSTSLINFLKNKCESEKFELVIGDIDEKLAEKKAKDCLLAKGIKFDIFNQEQRKSEIENADLVISMLPAHLHLEAIKECISFKKNIITPSYITPEIVALDEQAKEAGITIMNELGLDPGIDHMSAMMKLDEIREDGGELLAFESFTGGLVAPESDNNPWNYKFTWNPRNVVLAGQGGAAKFIQEGMYKYIPYHKLFRRTEIIDIEGFGKFEGYANRDSLKYRSVYGLDDIKTMYRGTLRRKGFCRAWDFFIQLGLTDDRFIMEDSENMTYREFINSFLAYNPHDSVELKLKYYLKVDQDDELWDKLEWLDLFSDKKIGIKNATPAMILQHILEQKWSLDPDDKDMIVMWHRFQFKDKEQNVREINSSMVVIGDDDADTAMSKTVGYPLGIMAILLLNNVINVKGSVLPIDKEVYTPILHELEKLGVIFNEKEVEPKYYQVQKV